MNQKLIELQAKNITLRNSISSAIVIKATSLWDELSIIINIISKVKTLRFKKMRLYKSQSENEHLRWFREIDIRFLNSFEYFITN